MEETKANGYPEGLFLSPGQVAADLGVSRSTVLRLIHAGRLPAIPAARRSYRIPKVTLERYRAGTLDRRFRVRIRRTESTLPPIGADEILPG